MATIRVDPATHRLVKLIAAHHGPTNQEIATTAIWELARRDYPDVIALLSEADRERAPILNDHHPPRHKRR